MHGSLALGPSLHAYRRSDGVVASFSGRRYRARRCGHCAVIPSGKPTSSEVPSPATAAMGAASSNGPYARAAVSDGSLLRWR